MIGRKRRRICIITGAPLCRNPRVVKEADALAAAGYEVTVLGPVFSEVLAREDASIAGGALWRHQATADLRKRSLQASKLRLTHRLGREAVRRLGAQTPLALGYDLGGTLAAARRTDADLYIGHQEVGLWTATRLMAEGHRAGVDFEDWYSADLLPQARSERPLTLLRDLESTAIRRMRHVTTTSHALADALSREYGAQPPTVVYNAFSRASGGLPAGTRRDRRDPGRPSLHWVSQTIGRGRGLETLFTALHSVEIPVEVHLRGHCSADEEERLRWLFPPTRGHELFVHQLVTNKELASRIAEHDIGLALESYDPPHKQYTVSNKILHYLVAGLAVVATDTAGQREVAAQAPGAVQLCRADDPVSLAAAVNGLLVSPDVLERAKRAARLAADDCFCWERQIPMLLRSVEAAFEEPRGLRCAAS